MIGSFEKMKRDMKNGVYDLTENGKCTQCGECCTNLLPMTDEEVEVIRKYIKRYNIKPQSHTMVPLAKPTIDMVCPFLDTKKNKEKCTIYEVIPRVCSDFVCDPKKRPAPPKEYAGKVKPIFVKETFFNQKER